jgi:hypothetical protein
MTSSSLGGDVETFRTAVEQEVNSRKVVAERSPQLRVDRRTKTWQAERDTACQETVRLEVLLYKWQRKVRS